MNVKDCMTRDVRLVNPKQTLKEAATMMAETDTGALPVGENDRLVGMITDRDIVVRAVCKGKGPDTAIGDVMTHDIKYCYEDDDVREVAKNMAQNQIRRLPVLSREKRMVGVVSIGDLACYTEDTGLIGSALGRISVPAAGAHPVPPAAKRASKRTNSQRSAQR
jgi:CBS domain-containing protein